MTKKQDKKTINVKKQAEADVKKKEIKLKIKKLRSELLKMLQKEMKKESNTSKSKLKPSSKNAKQTITKEAKEPKEAKEKVINNTYILNEYLKKYERGLTSKFVVKTIVFSFIVIAVISTCATLDVLGYLSSFKINSL